jgi:uncharacterized protein involved in response to NO
VSFFFAAALPQLLCSVLDLAFLPLVALSCALPLAASDSRRNYALVGLLLGLATANGVAHWSAVHGDILGVRAAHGAALNLIVLMIVAISGRIVPMFTRNATGLDWIRGQPRLDKAALVAVALLTLSDIWLDAPWVSEILAGVAALLLLLRMRFWGSLHTRRDPLLWILHVGVAWVPVGMLLRVGAALSSHIPASSALHALTVGAVGTLTLGMMARVSLGHTGRPLQAPRAMRAGFVCLLAATFLRVGAPFLPSSQYLAALSVVTLAWSGAFALFLFSYAKILLSARADPR